MQWGTRLQEQAARGPPTLQQSTLNAQFNYETLVDVCGDFRATLSESETLLKENLSYGQQRGMTTPLTNIKWNLAIRDTVERFSKRLSNHNQSVRYSSPSSNYLFVKLQDVTVSSAPL